MSNFAKRWPTWLVLGLGFGFLYLPILVLMFYSFNENKLATVWSGFSLKWYGKLLQNEQMLGAAWVSIKIAFCTATAAVVLGTLAALVMTRMRRVAATHAELTTQASSRFCCGPWIALR